MALLEFLMLTPKGKIGPIEIQATLDEVLSDSLQLTEHPVESGAAITDHAYMRPFEVVLHCGWTNSSIRSLAGTVSATVSGGGLSNFDYVGGIYSQLQALQQSRERFDITTSKRKYTDMLITGLRVTNDVRTSESLMVSVTCRQVIIVSTRATTLPPMGSQANPANTAEVVKLGVLHPVPVVPSPGGSVSPANM